MSGVASDLEKSFLRWHEAAIHRSVFCSAGPAQLVVVAE
jgi:hypothetical protein